MRAPLKIRSVWPVLVKIHTTGKSKGQRKEVETLADAIPSSLQEASAAVATILHWPSNLGIEFRPVRLQTQPATELLVLFVQGLADEELVRRLAIEPLEQAILQRPGSGRIMPVMLPDILAAPRMRMVRELSDAIRGVLEGDTALFFDGAGEAMLIATRAPVARPVGNSVPDNPYKEIFGPDLTENVALIRKRLRAPILVAEPHDLPRERAARAAILYAEGRADPAVLRQVTEWLEQCAGEEALHRGLGGTPAFVGLLPRLLSSPWPDRAAALLDTGHVIALVDRLPFAYVAPVTAPSLVSGPGDENLRRPIAGLLRLLRIALAVLILTGPATVVALMNYHQEMIPTPFLLGLASVRENAPLPIIAEVLGLELLQEVIRATSARLPAPVALGHTLLASMILAGVLVFGGIVAPVPAIISVIVTTAALGLPNSDLVHLVRAWRWPLIGGAAVFGLFGIAAVGFLLATYLTQAESFGVPFIGETGIKFTAPGRAASRQKGGSLHATGRAVR